MHRAQQSQAAQQLFARMENALAAAGHVLDPTVPERLCRTAVAVQLQNEGE
jgi:hypothetical protein